MARTPLPTVQAASPSRSAAEHGSRQPRCVLVVSTVEHAERELRSHLNDGDTFKVVVPVVRQGVLDWLANDEIVIAVRPPAQRGVVESSAAEPLPAGSFEGIPVRRIVMLETAERGSGPLPPVGMSSPSSPETVDTPTTRAAKTPMLALGGTVVVIALVFALALALAALAYVFAS